MKTPLSSRPNFICRLTRLKGSLLGDSSVSRGGHAARCADCQRYFEAVAALDLGLRSAARRDAIALPSDVEERVLQAAARSARPEKPSRSPWVGWSGWMVAAAAALAVVFGLHFRSRTGTSEGAPVAWVAAKAIPRLDLVWPAALAAENPLQSELNSVYSDARSAVRFLALNFLPSQAEDRVSLPAARDKG